MELLKERIAKDGTVIGSSVLKVDNFLNHQIDVKLFNEIGKEFRKRFNAERVDKILTVETSGVAIAAITSQYFDYVPVVFAKKGGSAILQRNTYSTKVFSFTKNQISNIMVSKSYLRKGERVLVIDDFLANGQAALGLLDIIEQAGAEAVGVGIVIEKGFQKGRTELEKRNVRVESLAIVEKMYENKIYFK